MFKFSQKSLDRMDGVDLDLQLIFIEALQISPIDFGIPLDGGARSAERQHELFLKNVSKCDGYEKRSNHQIEPSEEFGKALDFYAYVNGKASWESHHLSMVAAVILSTAQRLLEEGQVTIELRWGGTFGSDCLDGWDKPHIEIYG